MEEAAAAASCGEELEPLFDYSRVQPNIAFCFDDTDLEKSDIFIHCNKRHKAATAAAAAAAAANADADEGGKADETGVKKPTVVDLAEEWLPPPPPKPAVRAEVQQDSTLQELRLQKQELAKLAESALSVLDKLVKNCAKDHEAKKPPEHIVLDDSPEPQVEKEREKIVITIQDKDGQQQFRVYKDDKLDKLFKAFARKAKLRLSDLTFVFDGDKIDPASTPEDLGLEEDDMIEACHRPL